jgi:pimeloyl-ACP methyl ester carboxylesterase
MRVVYLHGFASSPQSSKAQYFARRLGEAGVRLEIPRLDCGRFEDLTITGQLEVVANAVGGAREPAVLIGSSLGGYLAALYASRHPDQAGRLVLLAPAFRFAERWRQRYTPEEFEAWRRRGWAPVYHYGTKRQERLNYSFFEDACRYELEPSFPQPALILHGTADPVVPYQISYECASKRSNIRLVPFEAGHELTEVLPELWREISNFLELL